MTKKKVLNQDETIMIAELENPPGVRYVAPEESEVTKDEAENKGNSK